MIFSDSSTSSRRHTQTDHSLWALFVGPFMGLFTWEVVRTKLENHLQLRKVKIPTLIITDLNIFYGYDKPMWVATKQSSSSLKCLWNEVLNND